MAKKSKKKTTKTKNRPASAPRLSQTRTGEMLDAKLEVLRYGLTKTIHAEIRNLHSLIVPKTDALLANNRYQHRQIESLEARMRVRTDMDAAFSKMDVPAKAKEHAEKAFPDQGEDGARLVSISRNAYIAGFSAGVFAEQSHYACRLGKLFL